MQDTGFLIAIQAPQLVVGYFGFPLAIRGNDKEKLPSFPNVFVGNPVLEFLTERK